MDAITTWSKSKQVDKIKDILAVCPTASDFKKNYGNDPKISSIVNQLPDDADKGQYVDFLQHVFVKHSKVGKYLANAAAGLLGSAALAYASGKLGQKVGEEKQNEAIKKSLARGAGYTAAGATLGAVGGGAAGASKEAIKKSIDSYKTGYDAQKHKNDIIDSPKFQDLDGYEYGDPKKAGIKNLISNWKDSIQNIKNLSSTNKNMDDWKNSRDYMLGDAQDIINNAKHGAGVGARLGAGAGAGLGALDTTITKFNNSDLDDDYKLKGQIAGGVAGALGGAGVANAIQSWREKKLQKQLDNLKK